MKKIIAILGMILLLPLTVFASNVHMTHNIADKGDNYVYLRTTFKTLDNSMEGRSFVSIPELGIKSPTKRIEKFSESRPVIASDILESNSLENIEYLRVSFSSKDKNDKRVRYVPLDLFYY